MKITGRTTFFITRFLLGLIEGYVKFALKKIIWSAFWLICESWQRIHPWCKSLQYQVRRHIAKPNKKRSSSIWAISTKTGNYPYALHASGPHTSRQTLFLLFSRTAFFIFVAGMVCKGGVGSSQLKVPSLASLAFSHGKLKIWPCKYLLTLCRLYLPPSPTQTKSTGLKGILRGRNGWFTEREEVIMVTRILRDDPGKSSMHNVSFVLSWHPELIFMELLTKL